LARQLATHRGTAAAAAPRAARWCGAAVSLLLALTSCTVSSAGTPRGSEPDGISPSGSASRSQPPTVSPSKPRATVSTRTPSTDDPSGMTSLPTSGSLRDAIIENSRDSKHSLRVCRDWGARSCQGASPTGKLKPGENTKTKFDWDDTDGYNAGNGWVQQHGCFSCVVSVVVP
jgi:hypothetical protein